MSTLWKSRYAQRTLGIKSSAIRELLKVTQKPEIISFGGGLPPLTSSRSSVSKKPATRSYPSKALKLCSTAPPKATSPCAR